MCSRVRRATPCSIRLAVDLVNSFGEDVSIGSGQYWGFAYGIGQLAFIADIQERASLVKVTLDLGFIVGEGIPHERESRSDEWM